MTMEVRIENRSKDRTCAVTVTAVNPTTGEKTTTVPSDDLGPGVARSFYIHAANELRVVERPEATR